jgi:hypothetical protein
MTALRELALVCKSKNAGPFELTIDVVMPDQKAFDRLRQSGVMTAALFARLYGVDAAQVWLTASPAGLAYKATLPRLVPAGDFGDTDVYGAQQHAPLLDVEIS